MHAAHMDHYVGSQRSRKPKLAQLTKGEPEPYPESQTRKWVKPQSHIEYALLKAGVVRAGMYAESVRGNVAAYMTVDSLVVGDAIELLPVNDDMTDKDVKYAHGYNIGIRALQHADIQARGLE